MNAILSRSRTQDRAKTNTVSRIAAGSALDTIILSLMSHTTTNLIDSGKPSVNSYSKIGSFSPRKPQCFNHMRDSCGPEKDRAII